MIHKPIQIKNLSLTFPGKICFQDFSTSVPYGSRIAIIGRNGSGKSTLLKIMHGLRTGTSGDVFVCDDLISGYVPQVIEEFSDISGGGSGSMHRSQRRSLYIPICSCLMSQRTILIEGTAYRSCEC